MSSQFGTDSERPAGSGVAGSGLWLFAPVAMVLFLALRERIFPAGDARSRSGPAAPESLGQLVPTTSLEGWIPRTSDGARLLVRLEPLHPDPARQAFDAAVLSERFRLAAGAVASMDGAPQPWRLTLIAEAGPDPASADGAAPLVVSLSDVTVEGLVPLAPGGGDGAADVDLLAAILGVASEPLEVGERADLIFWGPAPEAPTAITVPPLGSTIPLPAERQVRRRSEAVAWEDGRTATAEEAVK